MRKPEQKVYDTMKKNAPTTAWLQRVENIVGEGMPDVYVSGPESRCWVELKAAKQPVRGTTRLLGAKGLRQSQINWHLKAQTKNIRTYILIRDDAGNLYLIDGKHAASVNEWSIYTMGHLDYSDCKRTWDDIFKELMGYEN